MFQYSFSKIVVWLYIWLIVNYFYHKLSGLIRGTRRGAPLRGVCIISGRVKICSEKTAIFGTNTIILLKRRPKNWNLIIFSLLDSYYFYNESSRQKKL